MTSLALVPPQLNGLTGNKDCAELSKDYLWPGPKVIRSKADVFCLAFRWRYALIKGWEGLTPTTVKPEYVLAQYAPDGASAYKSGRNSDFAKGSVLLPTVDGAILDTNALREGYFKNTFLKGFPNPEYVGPFVVKQLAKDVSAVVGSIPGIGVEIGRLADEPITHFLSWWQTQSTIYIRWSRSMAGGTTTPPPASPRTPTTQRRPA